MAKIIIYIVILVVFLAGYVKYLEGRGIYFPVKEIEFTPALLGLAFEDVYIQTKDGLKLNGWFIPAPGARQTVLFLHGNAGNIGHRLDKIILLHKMRLDIFVLDYRGYGKSQGKPSEAGFYLDAAAAYDYLVKKRKISPENIILYGESLGCAVIIDLAAKEKVGGLIIEGGFSRGREMARAVYPFLPAFLFSNSYDNLSKIKKIGAPKLFIHSKTDEVVPFRLARRLYQASLEPKRFAEVFGGHNSLFMDAREEYVSAIKSFVKSLAQE